MKAVDNVIIDIGEYKQKILSILFNSETIVAGIDSQQPTIDVDEDGVDPDSPDTLVYNNLFPYLRIPETENEADTYILVAVDIININKTNPTYANYLITFWIMSHQKKMRMKGQNCTRIDYLSKEVKKLFDGNLEFGFNKLELISNKEVILNEKYQYRELRFVCSDQRHPVTNT